MLWLFLILAGSFGVVLWAGTAMYLRVRQHMNANLAGHKTEIEHEPRRYQEAAGPAVRIVGVGAACVDAGIAAGRD